MIEVLQADVASMTEFRSILTGSSAKQLDDLENDEQYGYVIAQTADILDLLPDDPRQFKTAGQLQEIHENIAIDESCSACIVNDTKTVALLASRVAVNTLDQNKQSPLSYAVGNNHIECIQLLLQHGAAPNLIQNWGNTSLHVCATTSVTSKAVLGLLVDAGGDLSVRNDDDKTPVDEMGRQRREEWMC